MSLMSFWKIKNKSASGDNLIAANEFGFNKLRLQLGEIAIRHPSMKVSNSVQNIEAGLRYDPCAFQQFEVVV